MNVLTRGVRNAFRNVIRTFSIVVILGLSVGLSLAMLVARSAVDTKIQSVKSSIGNSITVSPAGARGFQGGGEPLTTQQIDKLKSVNNVTAVSGVLVERLDSSLTNLQSAIEPGTLGKRHIMRGQDGQNSVMLDSEMNPEELKLPITATGTDDPSDLSASGGGTLAIQSGAAFASGSNDNVAMVAKDLAAKNNLSVGSKFQAYGQEITAVAIYDSGNKFANSSLMLPLATLQRLSGNTGEITNATVRANSIENVDSVVAAIQSQLGGAADVVSNKDTANQALEPLENIKNVTLFSLISAVAAGAVIIFLTMIMIVRERRREIGVLKAIGASNTRVMLQFVGESITLTMLGAVIGTFIGVIAASPLTQLLVTSSASSGTGQRTGGIGGGMLITLAQNGGLNLQNINVTIGLDILFYGLGAALIIAIAGSAAAAWLIAKIRPAEVMRSE